METDHIIYVAGHKNPDTDSVASAIAYAYLLRQTGMNAIAVVSGQVNQETEYVLECFGIASPAVVDQADGKQFILVDHSSYTQAIDGMEKAEVIGIIDHHAIGDVQVNDPNAVLYAPVGATATLVFRMYQKYNTAITKDMAGMMLAGLLSDTRNMKRNVTEEDLCAYNALIAIADIEDINAFYQHMSEAITSYGNLSDREIFYSDFKKYETDGKTFCISDVNAFGEDKVKELADRMYSVMVSEFENMETDMAFVILNNKTDTTGENGMYMLAYGNKATELLDSIFHNYDGERYFVFQKNLSRKTTVVPAIQKALKEDRI